MISGLAAIHVIMSRGALCHAGQNASVAGVQRQFPDFCLYGLVHGVGQNDYHGYIGARRFFLLVGDDLAEPVFHIHNSSSFMNNVH